jgi:hypothetical protein
MVMIRFFFELMNGVFRFLIPYITKRSIDYIQNWEEDEYQVSYFGLTS